MNLASKREFLKVAGGAAVLLPAFAATGAAGRAGQAPTGADYFTNAVLTAHDGRKLRFYDDILKGKMVVINMMYTTCSGVCPANTASIKAVQARLGPRVGRDIFFYSLSLRPEMDTPEALREYRERYEIKNSWTFLTGKPAEMDLIRRRLGFWDRDPEVDADLSQHAGVLRIGKVPADRWCMVPAMSSTEQIVSTILGAA